MNKWTYKGKEIDELPEGVAGFIYLITNLKNGKKYIGKKFSVMKTSKRVKTTTANAKKATRKVVTYKESTWKSYMGSSAILKEEITKYGIENFSREILIFGNTKGEVNFLEVFCQFKYNSLLDDTYYNNCIGSRDFIAFANNEKLKKIVENFK